jgi:hypothetical protein
MEHFLAALAAAGVVTLADVRAVPISRKPGSRRTRFEIGLVPPAFGMCHFRSLATQRKVGMPLAKVALTTSGRFIEGIWLDGAHRTPLPSSAK